MRTRRRTVRFGDLVVAVFDAAELYGTDRREVSRLATQAVADLLDHANWTPGSEGGHPPCRSLAVC
jgi:hypothetical protein